jgi:hypothetical protein
MPDRNEDPVRRRPWYARLIRDRLVEVLDAWLAAEGGLHERGRCPGC